MTLILEDHSTPVRRIVAFHDGHLYVCHTGQIAPGTDDGYWTWMTEDGTSGARVGRSVESKLDRALFDARKRGAA